ncbi:hypothetical protein TWF506_004919 [Arthrobotrys conoides]|uniref:Uncharacterized protein n=1 Tax=Arthrobotrys conoides TaxID=74498 RepID=A0AAN8RWF9_9PEZI
MPAETTAASSCLLSPFEEAHFSSPGIIDGLQGEVLPVSFVGVLLVIEPGRRSIFTGYVSDELISNDVHTDVEWPLVEVRKIFDSELLAVDVVLRVGGTNGLVLYVDVINTVVLCVDAVKGVDVDDVGDMDGMDGAIDVNNIDDIFIDDINVGDVDDINSIDGVDDADDVDNLSRTQP